MSARLPNVNISMFAVANAAGYVVANATTGVIIAQPRSMSSFYTGNITTKRTQYVPTNVPVSGAVSFSNFSGVTVNEGPYMHLDANDFSSVGDNNNINVPWTCKGLWGGQFVSCGVASKLRLSNSTRRGNTYPSVFFDNSVASSTSFGAMLASNTVMLNKFVTPQGNSGGTFASNLTPDTGVTVFFVVRSGRLNAREHYLNLGMIGGTSPVLVYGQYESDGLGYLIGLAGTVSATNANLNRGNLVFSGGSSGILPAGVRTSATFQVLTFRFNNSGLGVLGNKIASLFVNGQMRANVSNQSGAGTVAVGNRIYHDNKTQGNAVTLGINYGVNTLPFFGYISEVQLYRRTLSNDEISIITANLTTKWGL